MSLLKQVGLKEIAYELKVSVNTVSRALRDCDDISEEMKRKVCAKAIEMGYSPNNVEEYIKKDLKRNIAFLGPDFTNSYFMLMCNELYHYLNKDKFNFNVIISNSNFLTLNDLKRCILQRIDGIITFIEPSDEAIETAKLYRIPIEVVGREINNSSIDQLYTNDFVGGVLAGEYLIKTKLCKKVCFLTYENVECSLRRFEGFKKVCDENGVNTETFIVKDKNTLDINYFLENKFDGIFCFNDEIAYNLLYKFDVVKDTYLEEQLKNIKIIGYDALAHRIRGLKRITSINFNYHEIAKKAIEIIERRVLNSEDNSPFEKICFDVSLYLKKKDQ